MLIALNVGEGNPNILHSCNGHFKAAAGNETSYSIHYDYHYSVLVYFNLVMFINVIEPGHRSYTVR